MKNLLQEIVEEDRAKKTSFDKREVISKIQDGYVVNDEPKFTKKKTFSPSTLVFGKGKCPRFWYYAFEGAVWEDDFTPYSKANMGSGTDAHERIQKAMLDSGVLLEDEVKIRSEDPPIFGFADGIVSIEGERMVLEIKTMNEAAFEYRKVNKKPPSYHLEQLIIYMKVLKMEKGILLYENKNNHDLEILEVTVNDEYIEWVNKTFDWLKRVRKAWEDKQLPEKAFRSNSKVCKGCPVREICFADDKGDVKIERMEGL